MDGQAGRADQGSLIANTSAGYVLHVEPGHVDVNEFGRLVDVARGKCWAHNFVGNAATVS